MVDVVEAMMVGPGKRREAGEQLAASARAPPAPPSKMTAACVSAAAASCSRITDTAGEHAVDGGGRNKPNSANVASMPRTSVMAAAERSA